MKIIVNKEALRNAVNSVYKGVPRKSTIEVLKCIYVKVKDGLMSLEADDIKNRIRKTIEVESDDSIEFLVDASMLNNLVNKLKDDTVEIKLDEEKLILNIKNGKSYKCKMKYKNADDFPSASNKEFDLLVSIKDIAKDFENCLKNGLVAVSQDSSKPVLNAINIRFKLTKENDSITSKFVFESIDGFRLMYDELKVNPRGIKLLKSTKKEFDETGGVDYSIIIPTDSIKLMISYLNELKDKNEAIVLALGSDLLSLSTKTSKLLSTSLSGEFVDVKKLINLENTSIKIELDKELLKESIERAVLLAENTKNNLISFIIDKDKEELTISAENEVGYSEEVIELNQILQYDSNENFEIHFNSRYILQGLSCMDTNEISMLFLNDVSPTYMSNGKEAIHLVLPVRKRVM